MKNDVLFSTWLVPAAHDKSVLSKVIVRLGETLQSPSFLPHITAYAYKMPGDSLSPVVSQMEILKHNVHQFTLDVKKIDHSSEFFKAIFIELDTHPMLDLIYTRLKELVGQFGSYELQPHLSLAYKEMTERERQQVVESLSPPKTVTIGEIGYVVHHNWPADHRKADQWRYQGICQLQK